jgi:hypothetical protein
MLAKQLKRALLALIVTLGLVACAGQSQAFVQKNWSLLPGDPICPHRPGCHEQLHKVNLKAGVTYVIQMYSNQFDPYVYLEDANGNVLAEDGVNGGGFKGLTARIVFTPSFTGTYTIDATSTGTAQTGSYVVTVSP